MFKTLLLHFIRQDHELALLSKQIDWGKLEEQLSVYSCLDSGCPSVPIRTVASILF